MLPLLAFASTQVTSAHSGFTQSVSGIVYNNYLYTGQTNLSLTNASTTAPFGGTISSLYAATDKPVTGTQQMG